MADCCIIGCDNKAEKRGEIKFFSLPTARSSRPSKVKRRQLWLEVIEKANGTTEGLSRDDAQICSAHFVSGQMSLDVADQDFVPSVFPKEHTSKSRRQTLRPRSGVLAETPKVTPKKKVERKPANASERVSESNNIFSPENTYCEPLEDEDALEEEETPQPPSSEVIIQQEIIECVKLKKLKLQIKSIVDRFGQFRCEVCNGKFPTSSGLVKHKQLHEQEWSDEDEILPTESDIVVKSESIVKPVSVEEPSFQCNMCNRSFPTSHTLKRHKLLHVRDDRKCTQCGTMFCKRHNHVIAQPQISTEINFEEGKIKVDDMNETAECPMLNLSLSDSDSDSDSDGDGDSDGVDEDLKVLLNSNSVTLDAIAAAQEQTEPSADNLHKEAPVITYNPRKPGLLLAFKSFLTKHKNKHGQPIAIIPAIKELQATATCNSNTAHPAITSPCTTTAATITTTTAAAFPITAPITTTAASSSPFTAPITTTSAAFPVIASCTTTAAAFPITAPTTTTAASPITAPVTTTAAAFPVIASCTTTAAAFPVIASCTTTAAAFPITAPTTAAPLTSAATIITASTSGMTAEPVPETSSKTDALTTSTNTLTPQNITLKPVIYVAKSPQQAPGLPFQKMEQSTVCLSFSKPLPTNVIQEFMTYISKSESMKSQTPRLVTFTAKQDQVITKQEPNEIASIIKLEQSQTPISPEEPNKEKQTFIITTLRKPHLQTPPKILSKSNLTSPPQILPKINLQTTPQILKPHDQKLQFLKQTLNPKKVKPSPTVQAPFKRPYVHESRPPLPEPIFAKIKKSSWDLPIPNYPKDFVQPHLPQIPKLPPALQMFSPQFLTSAMLDVERNFEYILSDTLDAKT